MKKVPQGANALIQYRDDAPAQDPMWVYMSFGEYDEETEIDSFGIDDNEIFFYTNEAELIANAFGEFIVIEYELEYEALYYAA